MRDASRLIWLHLALSDVDCDSRVVGKLEASVEGPKHFKLDRLCANPQAKFVITLSSAFLFVFSFFYSICSLVSVNLPVLQVLFGGSIFVSVDQSRQRSS